MFYINQYQATDNKERLKKGYLKKKKKKTTTLS